jgi:hypothetical protein
MKLAWHSQFSTPPAFFLMGLMALGALSALLNQALKRGGSLNEYELDLLRQRSLAASAACFSANSRSS